MARTYHKIQQWSRWLETYPGAAVLEAEKNYLPHLLSQIYGNHAVLIGIPKQACLLQASSIIHRCVLSPLVDKNVSSIRRIECEYSELPIASASIDVAVMPHTLEFFDNPRHLLAEACRMIRPEGQIIICGFNPYSLWGLLNWYMLNKKIPGAGKLLTSSTVKQWLSLADFELVKQENILFRPPLAFPNMFKKIRFLEWLGRKLKFPGGGIYILIAKAKVVPLTPIRLRWQQKITNILPVMGLPKPTAREISQ